MSDQNNDLLSDENLGKAQAKNLAFLESTLEKTQKVCGVPILLVLNYEFIQILNNMYLQSILVDENNTESAETEDEKVSLPE